jgi:hypothetical protein
VDRVANNPRYACGSPGYHDALHAVVVNLRAVLHVVAWDVVTSWCAPDQPNPTDALFDLR